MRKDLNIYSKKRGFSLVETLVSLAIFSIISIFLGSVFISITTLQESIAGRNRQLLELNFALDYIHRSIANSQNPIIAGDCVGVNANFELNLDHNKIRFINKDGRCQEIFFYQPDLNVPGKLQTRISADGKYDPNAPSIDLTTDIITNFVISVEGNLIYPHDRLQPKIRITITSDIKETDIPITLQRTISRIKLDN